VSSKGRVCMITTGHSGLDDRILYKESVSLSRLGYEVVLFAPLNAEGSLFDMAHNSLRTNRMNVGGVDIRGFKVSGRQPGGVNGALRLAKLASVGGFSWAPEPFSNLIDLASALKADIYHSHEVWSLYVCIQIKKRLRAAGKDTKLIYDVHEYTPAVSSTSGRLFGLHGKVQRRLTTRFEREALGYVHHVITANQITRGYVLTLNRFAQVEVIYNCPILPALEVARCSKAPGGRVVICHEGSLSFDRGLRTMTETMRLLAEVYRDRVELLIVGDVFGEERRYFEEKTAEYGLDNIVRRTGWLPYEKVGEALSRGDIGVILMDPTENNMLAGPPNKLFNYMMAGLPVVSTDLPETSRIVLETGCGVIVRDREPRTLVSELSRLIEDGERRRCLGESGKRAVLNKYNWGCMEKRLMRVYEETIRAR